MMNTMKVSRSDKTIKAILAATYPEYKGRKITVIPATSYQMMDYWSEGSRHFVKAYALVNGRVAASSSAAQTPWRGEAHARVAVPVGILLVEHSIFCGKDCGITIYVNPENLAAALETACPHTQTISTSDAEVCTTCEAVRELAL